jgi:RimJ/RimL family protein N-acetyltransferase
MSSDPAEATVLLRDVRSSDVDVFYRLETDAVAIRMAAFSPPEPHDPAAFRAHWETMLRDERGWKRTILWGDRVAGYILYFELLGKPSIGYWIDRDLWGRGIATDAVKLLLGQVRERPLFARVAADNEGSIRVLEKAGFVRVGQEKSFAPGRGAEIEELVFRIDRA